MVLVLCLAIWADLLQMIQFYRDENWLLLSLSIAVLVASVMVILEAVAVIYKQRSFPDVPLEEKINHKQTSPILVPTKL